MKSKSSGELRRAIALAQERKSGALCSLQQAWQEIHLRRGGDAAIYDTSGTVLRSFGQIAAEALVLEEELSEFSRGTVVAIQLGNHPAWPAVLLACLRNELVALPLERTMAEQERDAALNISQAGGLLTCDDSGFGKIRIQKCRATLIAWEDRQPALLKL
ncbi:MAG: AMP-binding protein, partial [Chthoniobacterales bacterium]